MSDLKFSLLRSVSESSLLHPLTVDVLLNRDVPRINEVHDALESLRAAGLVQQPVGSASLFLTEAGILALESEQERRALRLRQSRAEIPAWIAAVSAALTALFTLLALLLR